MRRTTFIAALLIALLWSTSASANVWFEFLYAPCFTGDKDDVNEQGEISGAIDCYNDDFNGDGERTLLSIKAFQAWELGTMFLYYDITGPFNRAFGGDDGSSDNERGGFFGGITTTLSIKQVMQKITGQEYDWGVLANLHLKYEAEHVAKFGMLHYLGFQADLAVPFLDFMVVTAVIREDRALEGVDLQLGTALQKSFSLGPLDFIAGGFIQWGLFGEGESVDGIPGFEGNNFITAQPQILLDIGKLATLAPAKLYAGFEAQYTLNRYLIEGKSENLINGMIRWNI